MTEKLIAAWKKILSYTKSSWDIDDYPLRYKKQIDTKEEYKVGELKLWVVQIINWWTITGLGDTKEEAFKMLKTNFKNYLEYNTAPRPGTNVPICFAETTQMDKHEQVAVDFFDKILDYNYYECYITDESSLNDFNRNDLETMKLINLTYNLSFKDLGDGNLANIFTLIEEKQKI
ncbi:polysaccharide deacetylase family protein [Mucilaginibacter arboris]|uniref:Uncharacterized protein n=1 Tax=Mucilaginibacter arboris TaxID=2682090 RepID=A0A7K1T1N5_9SPHI|nr:hypothetical protein [Mucilaginibacter arboris]MVN23469.1 hypothetical protein [Mucilaginibacter arboris]